MADLKYDENFIPSKRFEPGGWLITRCIEDDHVAAIDLGWQDAGVDGGYRHMGLFQHESEAIFAIQMLESLPPMQDIKTTISNAGFILHVPTGLSHGHEPFIRQIREGALHGLLYFDDVNGTRLCLGQSEDGYRTIDIATLQFDTRGTKLSSLGQPQAVAATVLSSLLKARVEAGDAARPLVDLPMELTSSI